MVFMETCRPCPLNGPTQEAPAAINTGWQGLMPCPPTQTPKHSWPRQHGAGQHKPSEVEHPEYGRHGTLSSHMSQRRSDGTSTSQPQSPASPALTPTALWQYLEQTNVLFRWEKSALLTQRRYLITQAGRSGQIQPDPLQAKTWGRHACMCRPVSEPHSPARLCGDGTHCAISPEHICKWVCSQPSQGPGPWVTTNL